MELDHQGRRDGKGRGYILDVGLGRLYTLTFLFAFWLEWRISLVDQQRIDTVIAEPSWIGVYPISTPKSAPTRTKDANLIKDHHPIYIDNALGKPSGEGSTCQGLTTDF